MAINTEKIKKFAHVAKEAHTHIIIPHALVIAARTFPTKPRLIGEVIVALVNGTTPASFSEVQKYILADCREDLADLAARREMEKERKRRYRAKVLGRTAGKVTEAEGVAR